MQKILKIWALWLAAASIVTARAGSDKSVTDAQVNGTWKAKYGEFKIWALGQQHLQIEFSGVYEYKTPQGPSLNEGEGSSITTIPPSLNPRARRRMPHYAKIHCQQACGHINGICGFGHNVTARRAITKEFPQTNRSSTGNNVACCDLIFR